MKLKILAILSWYEFLSNKKLVKYQTGTLLLYLVLANHWSISRKSYLLLSKTYMSEKIVYPCGQQYKATYDE